MIGTVVVDRLACVLAWFRQGCEGAQKIAEDVARYRALLEPDPGVVVETGTGSGRFALFLANLGCRVVTVDIDPWASEEVRAAWGGRVTYVVGDSSAPGTLEAVRNAVGADGPVLVSLDSDHSAAHVRAEMEIYGGLVTPGSHMVVEDTVMGWLPPAGPVRKRYDGTPMEAVGDFLASHDSWEVDREIEAMFPATQHVGGWLRRTA